MYDAVNEAVEGTVTKIKAIDITFKADGVDVTPAKPVKVTMKAYDSDADKEQSVVHIDDNKNVSVVNDASIKKSGSITTTEFKTDEFSIYAIVTTGDDARLLVKFRNGESEIASIYVKKGDNMEQVLYDPGIGNAAEDESINFLGWTEDPNYTDETTPLTIQDVRNEAITTLDSGVTDGQTVTYYAMLFKSYIITYFDEKHISLGEESVSFRADSPSNEQEYTVNMAYTVPDNVRTAIL